MSLAGAVEFSTLDIALILLAMAGMFLAVPVIGGTIGVIAYLRRTPESDRTRDGKLRAFGFGLLIGIGIELAVWMIGGILVQLF